MKNVILTDIIHIDATYMLNWPVLVCGSTDKSKKFHPFGVALVSHEKTEDFSLIFIYLLPSLESFLL